MKAAPPSRSPDVLLRKLRSDDALALRALLARDPLAQCFVAARIGTGSLDAWELGGEFTGVFDDDVLVSAMFHGANLVPIETTEATREVFVQALKATGRRCSSIVGVADEVLSLWSELEGSWGVARDVRANQPLLVMDQDPVVALDPDVKPVRIDRLDDLLPACIEMFTEEVGISPVSGGAKASYRARVAEIVSQGRALASMDGAGVMFKAEIGAATDEVCQVQGVWVRRELRGQGRSIPGMASVVAYAREHVCPQVTLYVNEYNAAARAAYDRVGFRQHCTFATILF